MVVATPPKMAVDEFCSRHSTEAGTELVRGELIRVAVATVITVDRVVVNVAFALNAFLDRHDLGYMLSGSACVCTAPDTVRVADVAYWSKPKLPIVPDSAGPIRTPPDAVFEVRRRTETWLMRLTRAVEYLRAGVPVAVIFDSATTSAVIYRSAERPQIVEKDETLTIPDVLPGFEMPVVRFFEE